ncbi:hypothetical protein [Edwardsiella piscicida]|uniref:hypothetical protein n=1 Tax=Edwardsiella piscicida TaxID=1263550 RepID=UPI00370D872C
MSVVHTRLNLFGGDTLIVRCAHRFSVHLASDENPHLQQAAAILSQPVAPGGALSQYPLQRPVEPDY